MRLRTLLLVGSCLSSGLALDAGAVERSPLSITPLRVGAVLAGPGAPICGEVFPTGSAVFAQLGQGSPLQGDVQLSATAQPMAQPNSFDVYAFGQLSGGPAPFTFLIEAVVEVDVPALGGPTAPVFLRIQPPAEHLPEWLVRSVVVTAAEAHPTICGSSVAASPRSQLLASGVAPAGATLASYTHPAPPEVDQSISVPLQLFAGDSVTIPILIRITTEITAPIALIEAYLPLTFETVTPAIGSGDMNGDLAVDVVDSTLLRRLLAGLPID